MERWNCVAPRVPAISPRLRQKPFSTRCSRPASIISTPRSITRLSEERIGRYISHRRAEYYLASKCGCLVGGPPTPRKRGGPHVFTRENVVAGVEQSRVRMKTDYLDVVQFHASPSRQAR